MKIHLGMVEHHGNITLLTPPMRIALEDLRLERIAVVYPGPCRYQL
jgi:hypothetical protein